MDVVNIFKSKKIRHTIVERTPSKSEQNVAKSYCLHRPLYRPKTNIKMVLIWLFWFEIGIILTTFILGCILRYFGVSFSSFLGRDIFYIYNLISLLFLMIFFKQILILIIELYQHYAPEEMRRKCLLMPTCSEYAVLALQKHGVIKGLYKTYIRLTKKCKGETYYIDYP